MFLNISCADLVLKEKSAISKFLKNNGVTTRIDSFIAHFDTIPLFSEAAMYPKKVSRVASKFKDDVENMVKRGLQLKEHCVEGHSLDLTQSIYTLTFVTDKA